MTKSAIAALIFGALIFLTLQVNQQCHPGIWENGKAFAGTQCRWFLSINPFYFTGPTAPTTN